jgi:hypothetical protein
MPVASSPRLGTGAPQHLFCLSPSHTDNLFISTSTRALNRHIAMVHPSANHVRSSTSAPGSFCVTTAAPSSVVLHHATRSVVVPTLQRVGLKANCWCERASYDDPFL